MDRKKASIPRRSMGEKRGNILVTRVILSNDKFGPEPPLRRADTDNYSQRTPGTRDPVQIPHAIQNTWSIARKYQMVDRPVIMLEITYAFFLRREQHFYGMTCYETCGLQNFVVSSTICAKITWIVVSGCKIKLVQHKVKCWEKI